MDLVLPAILSGLFAGCVAIGVTSAIERLGGVWGGVLATIPTTVVPACLGLSYRLSGDGLTASLFAIPPGMLVNAGFLTVWRMLPSRLPKAWGFHQRLSAMIAASLSVWGLGAGIMVALNVAGNRTLDESLGLGFTCTALLFVVGLIACFRPLEAPKGTNKVPLKALLMRAGVAFTAITTAILLSKVDDVVAGFVSTFPAIFLTSMVSVWVSQGDSVSIGATGPMILGSTSVPTFAVIFAGLMSKDWNPFAAAILTWPISILLTSVPVALFIRWRRQKSAGVDLTSPTATSVPTGLAQADAIVVDQQELGAPNDKLET